MSIEKIHEKALHIGSISDLKRELEVDLTSKEEQALEKYFKPFELAKERAKEVRKKIDEQSEEKIATLRELVSSQKETKEATEQAESGLLGELQKKTEETKKQIETKTSEALSPFEKMRENIENTTKDIAEKITYAWEKIITPIKFGWYSIWAYFGFKYGKEGLAALAKEKVDTVTEDLKKKSEEKEQAGENAGPIALLGTAGLGIFGFIKSQLPKSVADKIDATDKKSILTGLAQNRALKLFGFGGLTLFGLGQLAKSAENPEIKAEMGEIPQDKEGQKTWLKKLVEKSADIGNETKEALMSFISEGWDYARGEKLDEYLSKDEKPREGMVTLEEKFQPIGIHLENMGYDIRDAAEKIGPLLIGTGILVPQIRALEIGALKSSVDIVKILTKLVGKNIFGTLFAFTIIMNSATLAGHKIHVPKNNDDLGDWLRELLHLPEVKETLKKNDIPDEVIDNLENNLQETVTILTSEQEREKILKEKRSQLSDAIGEKAESVLYPKRAQLIQQKTTEGIANFNGKLWRYLRENKDEKVQNLITKAQEVSERMKKKGKITKKDIQELMMATQGTPVRIHDKSGNYIRWSILDEGKTIIQSSGVLCVNPLLTENDQYHAARKIVTDEEGGFLDSSRTGQGLEIGSALFQGIGGRLRHEVASWKEALDKNDTSATASSFEKIKNEFGIIYKSGEFFLVDGGLNLIALPYTLSKNIFKRIWLGKGDMTTEEFVVETADGITPILLAGGSAKLVAKITDTITAKSSFKTNLNFGLFNVLARYTSLKGQINLINKLRHTSDLIELLGDSRLQIQDGFYNFISKSRNLTYSLGGIVGGNMRKLAHTTRDLGMAESISRKLEFIERKNKLSRGGHEPTGLLEEMKKELREYFKHHHLDENSHPLAKFARINNVNDIPQARANIMADLQNFRNVQSGLKKGLSSSIQSNARRLQDVIKNIPASRLKKIGGLAGLIALLAIPTATAIGSEYFNNKESANGDNDGLGESYDNVDYGKFGEGIKSEKIDNSAPEMSEVFKAVDNIKDTLIGEDFDINTSLLSNDVQLFIKTGEAEMKKYVDDIYPRYENSINSFRKTIQENREILERYFRENPEKQKKEIKICEFLGLGWKNNKLSLNYMSKEKFENHFYSTFDHVKNNIGDYLDDGHQSGGEKAGEVGKNLTPYVSSWIDTKQAFADIGRGHVKSAILNGTMATLGWTSDVLMTLGALSFIVSGPVGPAAGIGGGAALRGINAAIKTSKFGKGIILGEQALEIGTQTAQGMYLAVEKDKEESL